MFFIDGQHVIGKDMTNQEWYGCTDGTTRYMKVKAEQMMKDFSPCLDHEVFVVGGEHESI
ncbi:hypothetical protein [Priestia megaterium]|uniref:hypothetical protein n=1 Tax=Priestia megaterium TaxID=1404 RepID=UPI0030006FA8